MIAQREKLEKERKRYVITKNRRFHLSGSSGVGTNANAISGTGIGGLISSGGVSASLLSHHTDKYGILGPLQKRQSSSALAGAQAQAKIDMQMPYDQYLRSLVTAGETVDSFEPLSSDFYTKEANISSSMFIFRILILPLLKYKF